MESAMTQPQRRSGFVLVTVLIITAVGLLFGAGALMLFRFQCEHRIDRQHELEKVYSVRSALNWIRTYGDEIEPDGIPFSYHTWSGRDLRLRVKPVAIRFPDKDNPEHFTMEGRGPGSAGEFRFCTNQYDPALDYEYGATEGGEEAELTDMSIRNTMDDRKSMDQSERYGLAFADSSATNGVKWWVNIGMRGKGGWLTEKYGMRYRFWPRNYVGESSSTNTKDLVRLCIIRNTNHVERMVGQRHGWPLSPGERALILEMNPKAGDAEIEFYEQNFLTTGVISETPHFCRKTNQGTMCRIGLQIAGNVVSLLYIDSRYTESPSARAYTFCGSVNLTPETYRYFSEGCVEDAVGNVISAPDLRAVFEVEAKSDVRPIAPGKTSYDFLTEFAVTPAWQYDVLLEYPESHVNRATIAQKIGEFENSASGTTVLTYDTHGTENKGFRKDEREAEEK